MKKKTDPRNHPKDITPLPVNRAAKALTDLVNHISVMQDDAYLSAHPEWEAIVTEAKTALAATNVPLVMPKDRTAGLANFVRMIIDEIETENFKEAHYLAIDLWNDIGTSYVIK